jgi:hypothetical protein
MRRFTVAARHDNVCRASPVVDPLWRDIALGGAAEVVNVPSGAFVTGHDRGGVQLFERVERKQASAVRQRLLMPLRPAGPDGFLSPVIPVAANGTVGWRPRCSPPD